MLDKKNLTLSVAIAALSIVLLAAYCFFIAPLGYNPTDDGVVLSLARRIFAGEIPHKDFISIRPVGSGILHLPELMLGGNDMFLISRFVVCFQIAIISIFSLLLIEKASNFASNAVFKSLIFFIAFFLSLFSFPLMAWTTVDAIFCVVVGTWFSTHDNKYIKQFGYGIAGFAALCKQNFLLMPFLLILLNRDYKNVGVWLFTILPFIVYAELVYFSKSWNDAVIQLSSRTQLMQTGVLAFAKNPFLWLGFGVSQLVFWLFKTEKLSTVKNIFILLLPALLLGLLCYRNSYKAVFFLEFGVLFSLFVFKSWQRNNVALFLFFVLMLAWSTAISLGYNSPALAAGVMWVAMLSEITLHNKFSKVALSFCFFISFAASFYLRTHFIYREKNAKYLTTNINGVNGFGGIKTNTTTASAMIELNKICKKLHQNNYCLLTDYAGFWAAHWNNNLLPLDWVVNNEMPTEKLLNRSWKMIANNQKIRNIIVQKYESEFLCDSLVAVTSKDLNRTLMDSVQLHYIKKWEGKYFSVFTKPMQ